MADFMKDLPSRDRSNFTRLGEGGADQSSAHHHHQNARPGASVVSRHRSAMYVPTKEYPSEQVIHNSLHRYILNLMLFR